MRFKRFLLLVLWGFGVSRDLAGYVALVAAVVVVWNAKPDTQTANPRPEIIQLETLIIRGREMGCNSSC